MHCMEKRQSHITTNADSESERSLGEPWWKKQGLNACKERIAETEWGKERNRGRLERGAGDVLMELGNRHDDQVVRTHLAVTSVKDTKNNLTSWGRQYDISKKLRVQQRFPTQQLLWNILRVVRHKVGWVRTCAEVCHVDGDVQIYALDVFYEMDLRKSRYIREVL